MLPSEILKHERNMIIGLLPSPVVCGWCGYPVIIAVGPFLLDPGCPGGPLSAPDPGGPLSPFLSFLARCLVDDPGRPCFLCPLGGPVEGLARLLWM